MERAMVTKYDELRDRDYSGRRSAMHAGKDETRLTYVRSYICQISKSMLLPRSNMLALRPSTSPRALALLQQLIPPLPDPTQELRLLQEPSAVLLSIRGELFRERRVTRSMRGPIVCGLDMQQRLGQSPGRKKGERRGGTYLLDRGHFLAF